MFEFIKSIFKTNKTEELTEELNKSNKNILTVKVAGVNYRNKKEIESLGSINDEIKLKKADAIKKYPDGCTIYEYSFPLYEAEFQFEPTNEHDPNAIKVLINKIHVGYVKKGSCSRIKNLINNNKILSNSAKIYGGKYKSLDCYCGEGEKPKASDYIYESNNEEYGVILTLTLKED